MGQDKVVVSVTADIDFTKKIAQKTLLNLLIKKTWKVLQSARKRFLKHTRVMVH